MNGRVIIVQSLIESASKLFFGGGVEGSGAEVRDLGEEMFVGM